MIKLYINDTDRTTYLQKDSLSVNETITADNNTCSFVLENYIPTEGQQVNIYTGQVTAVSYPANASPQVITLSYTAENIGYTNQFRVNEYVIIGLGTATEETCLISAVGTNTITTIITFSHSAGEEVVKAKKVFAGLINKVVKTAITPLNNYLEARVDCVGYEKQLSDKLVDAVYVNRSGNYVLLDILNNFVNYNHLINDFEYASNSALQAAWPRLTSDANDATRNSTTFKEGDYAANFPFTYSSGTAMWYMAPTSTNISGFTGVNSGIPTKGTLICWLKPTDYTKYTSVKLRLGSSDFNYMLYNLLGAYPVTDSETMEDFEYANDTALRAVWDPLNAYSAEPTLDASDYKIGSKSCILQKTGGSFAKWEGNLSAHNISSMTGATTGAPVSGVLSFWLYIPASSVITLLILKIGLTTGHNISFEITTGFTTGWQLITLNLKDYKTMTGTPDWTVCNYLYVDITGSNSSYKIDGISVYGGTTFVEGTFTSNDWKYCVVDLTSGTKTGTPDWTAMDFAKLIITETASDTLIMDGLRIMESSGKYFTLNNVTAGLATISAAKYSLKYPADILDQLAEVLNYDWWVDYDKDIHFILNSAHSDAPFTLTDSSLNYSDLKITPDVTQLCNSIYVRGGTEPSPTQTDYALGDGITTMFKLKNKPRTIGYDDTLRRATYDFALSVDTGAGFVAKTVGIVGIDTPASYEWMLDPDEQYVEPSTDGVPAVGDEIKFVFTYDSPILAYDSDATSIATQKAASGGDGYREKVIINSDIKSTTDALTLAASYLAKYKDPIVNFSFTTEQYGLEAGQLISLTNATLGYTNEKFLIQSLDKQLTLNNEIFINNVNCASSAFGLTDLFKVINTKEIKIDNETYET